MKKLIILGMVMGLIPAVQARPYFYNTGSINHSQPAQYSQVQKGTYYTQNQNQDLETADAANLNSSSQSYEAHFGEKNIKEESEAKAPASAQDIIEKARISLRDANYGANAERINISAYNGVVTLRGSVESQSMKNSIENKIKQIKGVNTVNNQLTIVPDINSPDHMLPQGPFGQSMRNPLSSASDKQITNKVSTLLNSSSFTSKDSAVSFTVQDGIVTLKGTVNSIEQKTNLGNQIQNITGVKSVDNQLSIRH